jgi:predicted  nucleic acid-binding Zn-ribbon protein
MAEIRRLQAELDQANQSVDDKLDRLEESGNGVIGLAKKLEDARATITALEEESARLRMKDERRTRRLQQTKCGKCRTKIDLRRLDADQR